MVVLFLGWSYFWGGLNMLTSKVLFHCNSTGRHGINMLGELLQPTGYIKL